MMHGLLNGILVIYGLLIPVLFGGWCADTADAEPRPPMVAGILYAILLPPVAVTCLLLFLLLLAIAFMVSPAEAKIAFKGRVRREPP